MNRIRTSRSRVIRALFSILFIGIWSMGSSVASAACLTGQDATGLEVGTHTLSVTIPNIPVFTEVRGISCVENSGNLDPGASQVGGGQARFVASSLGYRARTASNVGGLGTGTGGASVSGSVRYLIRAQSTPSYSGPTTVELVVTMEFDASGGLTVSGVGSAGGGYSTDVTLQPADFPMGVVQLFLAGGGLAAGGSSLQQNSTPIDIDRDYVLQIVHVQNVTTSFSTGPMGQIGSAASSGVVAISFESHLALPNSQLSIEYPMVGLLGVPAPSLGNPPVFPISVPLGGAAWGALLALLMTGAAISKLR